MPSYNLCLNQRQDPIPSRLSLSLNLCRRRTKIRIPRAVGKEVVGKEKGEKAEGKNSRPHDGAQVLDIPPQNLGMPQVGNTCPLQVHNSVAVALQKNALEAHTCQYMGLREKIHSWEQLGAEKVLLQAIKTGVRAPLCPIPAPNNQKTAQRKYSLQDLKSLQTKTGEYCQTQVIRPLTEQQKEKKQNIGSQYFQDRKRIPTE
jgi:hypothetical protein